MPEIYLPNCTGDRQARITPFQKFNGKYLNVIYNSEFPDILTVTEKKLLQVLNK